MAKRPNVCCKVSGIVASTKGHAWRPDDLAPIINHVLDVFGPGPRRVRRRLAGLHAGRAAGGLGRAPSARSSATGARPTSGSSSTTTPSGFIG